MRPILNAGIMNIENIPWTHYLGVFVLIFLLFTVVYYLVPVGFTYYVFFIRNRKKWGHRRIQGRFPDRKSIYREIRGSLSALFLFSVMTLVLYHFTSQGYSAIYYKVSDYGWVYLILSPILAALIHDTYHYWMHRYIMHSRIFFRYIHKLHHQSTNPSPWSIFAFQPAEAFLAYIIFPALFFVLPMHPIAIGVLLLHNLIVNTGGHIGFEITPAWFSRHWFFRWVNVVTHHDMHHTKFNCHYGLYFNIWDRIMGTIHPEFEEKYKKVARGKK